MGTTKNRKVEVEMTHDQFIEMFHVEIEDYTQTVIEDDTVAADLANNVIASFRSNLEKLGVYIKLYN